MIWNHCSWLDTALRTLLRTLLLNYYYLPADDILDLLTEHKRATRNGNVNNHITEQRLRTKPQIDWDSATCITGMFSTDVYQRLPLESWFTNLEQTPLYRSQQLPAP